MYFKGQSQILTSKQYPGALLPKQTQAKPPWKGFIGDLSSPFLFPPQTTGLQLCKQQTPVYHLAKSSSEF